MIDPSIITRGAEMAQLQQRQNMDALADLGGNLGQLVLGRRINQMQQLKTPEEQQSFANKSIFSPQLNQQLKADQTAALKAANDQLKFNAELAKTGAETGKLGSEAFKNNAQGQGYGLENAGRLVQNANRALMVAAESGDPMAAKLALNNLLKAKAINPEIYEQYSKQVDILGTQPEALKQFIKGLTVTDEKVAPYFNQTANNAADNEQSNTNSERTYKASIHSTDVGAETADKNRKQQQSQFNRTITLDQAKLEHSQGKGQVLVFGNQPYMIYPDGSAIPISTPSGQKISAEKPETKIQTLERKEKVMNYATASKGAADGSKLASNILQRYKNLGYNAARFAAESMVPGTEAYNIARDVETLKSNVFLAKAGDMRGLGALTDSEGARLENSMGSLNPMQGDQFIQNLSNIAQQFSIIAKNNANKASLHNGGAGYTGSKQVNQTQNQPSEHKGSIVPLSDVKAAAQKSGISATEMAAILESQGLIIR